MIRSRGIYEFKPEDVYRFAQSYNHHKRGSELVFQYCPFCNGGSSRDKGTFSISLSTGQYECKRGSCEAKGNMLTLAQAFGFSLDRITDEYLRPTKVYRRFQKKEIETTEASKSYLQSRGISEQIINKYSITSKDDGKVIVFPFFDEKDELTFIKYRNINPEKGQSKEWTERDCKPILFGMNQHDPKNRTMILTEGQIDSLSVAEAGFSNAFSVPLGKNGFTWVSHCWNWMNQSFDKLIVFGDYENGEISLLKQIKKFFNGQILQVREIDYKNCKDANEILQKYGTDAIKDCIENAIPEPNKYIINLKDVKRQSLKDRPKFKSGFRMLDSVTGGFYMGQLIIVTGECGLGKSTLVSQWSIEALNSGYNVFAYSGELPNHVYLDWVEQQMAGMRNVITTTDDTGCSIYEVKAEIRDKISDWYDKHYYLYDYSDIENKDKSLLEVVEESIIQFECKVIIIDNLMTAISDDLQADMYRMQSKFVRDLALLVRKYDVCIFLVAHPKKKSSFSQEFSNDDVSGSSNITNLAHLVLSYATPTKEQAQMYGCPRRLILSKNRMNGRVKPAGIPMYFQEPSKRVSDVKGDFTRDYGWKDSDDDFEQLTTADIEELPWQI